jgi:predicted dehydrogenase
MTAQSSDRPRHQSTRRDFIRRTAAVTGVIAVSSLPARSQARVLGANDRIGIGFIGCGGRGGYLMNALKEMQAAGGNFDILAVCDTYRPRATRQADLYKAKSYMDHRELLADPRVDVVGITTPDHIHGYQVIDAVQAGKNVYCEKPVTHWRQFELTKRMAAEVAKSGRVFQLGSQGMSNTAWHQARKLIADGLIGQPIHAECGYFRVGDWGEAGMSVDDPEAKPGPDLNWDAFLGDAPKRPFDVSRYFRWRLYEDYSGGPATDLYPHSLTPVIYMLGVSMPATAVGSGGKYRYFPCKEREVPDTANIILDYPERITVVVLGTQGNNFFTTEEMGSVGRAPTIRGWEGTLSFTAKEIVFTPAFGSKKEPQRFPVEHGEDVKLHWQDFLDCCRAGKQPNSPADLAYKTQTALQMGIWSWRAGKTARFDKDKETILV